MAIVTSLGKRGSLNCINPYIKTRKQKSGNYKVFQLVKALIDSDITKKDFDRLLETLITN